MAAPMKFFNIFDIAIKRTSALEKTRFLRCLCRCQSTTAVAKPRTWQLHSAVYLQRFPIITSELTPFEQKYKSYLQTGEDSNSLLSDHELKKIADEKEKKLKEDKQMSKKDIEASVSTAIELEDKWQKELEQFKLADRITDADRSNDLTSTNRKLDEQLILIVKQKLSNTLDPVWILPQGRREEGESMRQAAERALKTCCGDSIETTFLGNAPCGFYKFKLPPGEEFGVKVFFFKAMYKNGTVLNMDNVVEYKWVTRKELQLYLNPLYLDDVEEFIMDFEIDH